jgi:hypothetical protein
MLEKLKQLVNSMNSKGIPIPMVRDSKTGLASMTATMSVISFSTALLGQAGKIAGFLGGVDLSQATCIFFKIVFKELRIKFFIFTTIRFFTREILFINKFIFYRHSNITDS